MNFNDLFLLEQKKQKQQTQKSDAEVEQEIRSKMKLGKEYLMYYKGKWIIDTDHKLERTAQRGSASQQEDFFKKAIDWIVDKKKGPADYLFVSKSSKLAAVLSHRKDRNNRVKGNILSVVTWLGDVTGPPLNKNSIKDVFAKKDTIKVILESLNINDVMDIIELD